MLLTVELNEELKWKEMLKYEYFKELEWSVVLILKNLNLYFKELWFLKVW
jgi:hypothetical protein